MKYTVKNRDKNDFEITKIEIEEATKTRPIIAIGTLITCLLFLLGSALFGLKQGEFTALQSVLTYVEPIIGVIIGYYFGKNHV